MKISEAIETAQETLLIERGDGSVVAVPVSEAAPDTSAIVGDSGCYHSVITIIYDGEQIESNCKTYSFDH